MNEAKMNKLYGDCTDVVKHAVDHSKWLYTARGSGRRWLHADRGWCGRSFAKLMEGALRSSWKVLGEARGRCFAKLVEGVGSACAQL